MNNMIPDTLPVELLELVFRWLRLSRDGHVLGNTQRPPGLTDDDKSRRRGLYSLCLTSKKTSHIATPLLYADVIVGPCSPTTIRQMTCLFRTLFEKFELSKCIQHVVAIHPMGMLHEDLDRDQVPERMAAISEAKISRQSSCARVIWGRAGGDAWTYDLDTSPEQAQVTLLLALSINLRHLTLGTYYGSLKRLLELPPRAPENIARHLGIDRQRFLHLQSLDVYIDTDSFPYNIPTTTLDLYSPEEKRYMDLICTFEHLPALRVYRHASPTDIVVKFRGDRGDIVYTPSLGAACKQLTTLHLIDGIVHMKQIISTVKHCTNLKEFRYRMATLPEHIDFKTLFAALSLSSHTLKYLYLSKGREVDTKRKPYTVQYLPPAGTLVNFTRLLALIAPVDVIMGGLYDESHPKPYANVDNGWEVWTYPTISYTGFQFPLAASECIPSSLRTLGLSDEYCESFDENFARDLDNQACILLAQDIEQLPNLRTIRMTYTKFCWNGGGHEVLKAKCEERGIDYKSEEGIDDMDLLRRYYAESS
jgi:hypothetical protein